MRGATQYGGGGYVGGGQKPYNGGAVTICTQDDPDYQQLGGLRRLDSASSMRAHFYPEGGWGWIVCACAFLAHVTTSGAQLSAGALHIVLSNKFQDSHAQHWLGPLSWSVSSICSPLVVNLCRRKNVRILSLVGGFLFPLSLLFTSFATELHQIFFTFGLIGGIGSCLVRESSGVVLGEYFRRRRHFVEQVVLAGTGVGVTLFSLLYLSLSRHIEWAQGFRIGAGLSTICALLPAFYRNAALYHPNRAAVQQLKLQRQLNKTSGSGGMGSSLLLPLGGDIFHSLHLFCVPSLKPILWSASISSFGLYAPVFLMSDFGRKEGLSGGSLLLLQTHLGLGLSLGVILGAILTLKKFRCCNISPRMLCSSTCLLTGISMIAISSVKGYYGYSLSAWIYGIALGSYLYTLKVLTMELTRTKYWSRIWSCVESLMGPGILIGTGATSYLGKPGFYACATCVLIGAGLIGFQLIDLSKCGSPPLSSLEDNESPIPPVPPPITPDKYGHGHGLGVVGGVVAGGGGGGPLSNLSDSPGFFPLRKSVSLQQPFYPCCPEDPISYSPHCPDCNPLFYPPMVRSFSLPQSLPQCKSTGTQTNPNSPERHPLGTRYQQQLQAHQMVLAQNIFPFGVTPGGFDLHGPSQTHHSSMSVHSAGATTVTTPAAPAPFQHSQVYPEPLARLGKHSVMFASNPQLYPQSSFSSQTDSSRPPSSAANFYALPHPSHPSHHHPHQHRPSGQVTTSGATGKPIPKQSQFQVSHRQENPETQRAQQTTTTRSIAFKLEDDTFADVHKEPPKKPAFTRHYFDSSKILANKKSTVHVQFKKPERENGEEDGLSNRIGPNNKYPLQKQANVSQSGTDTAIVHGPPSVTHFQEQARSRRDAAALRSAQGRQQMQQQLQQQQMSRANANKDYAQTMQAHLQSYAQSYVRATEHFKTPQHTNAQGQAQNYAQKGAGQSQHHHGGAQEAQAHTQQQQSHAQQHQGHTHQHQSHALQQQGHTHQHQGHVHQQGHAHQQQSHAQQHQTHAHQQQSHAQHQSRAQEHQGRVQQHQTHAQQQQAHAQQQQILAQQAQSYVQQHLQNYAQQQGSNYAQGQSQSFNTQSHVQVHNYAHAQNQPTQQGRKFSQFTPTPMPSFLQQQQQQQQQQKYQQNLQHFHIQHQPHSAHVPQTYQYAPLAFPYYAQPKQQKISSSEFDIEEPKFNSLRRPTSSNSNSTQGGGPPTGSAAPSTATPCPYCDLGPDRVCPPLSLSVPIIQPSNPHLMCHYGVSANHLHHHHPYLLRRRNTWHYHKDYLEAITTSV